MKLALISCLVLSRDLSYCIYNSKNTVQSFTLEQQLHDKPDYLKQRLQAKINEIEEINERLQVGYKFDAIILGYGLCSNGIVGLTSETLPLVVPRCDDCMALFLGSQDRYLQLFHNHKGIYWFNKTWVESAFIPTEENYQKLYQHYLEEYGEDNADYLMEMETGYTKNYQHAIFIKSNIYDDEEECQKIQKNAEYFGWNYIEEEGKTTFLQDLVNGNWDERFLVCPPTYVIEAEYTGLKVIAKERETHV